MIAYWPHSEAGALKRRPSDTRIADGPREFGPPGAKLAPSQRREIIASPDGCRVLAARYGVSDTLIKRIRRHGPAIRQPGAAKPSTNQGDTQ